MIAEIRSEVSAAYADVMAARQQVDITTRQLASAEAGFREDLERIRNTVGRPHRGGQQLAVVESGPRRPHPRRDRLQQGGVPPIRGISARRRLSAIRRPLPCPPPRSQRHRCPRSRAWAQTDRAGVWIHGRGPQPPLAINPGPFAANPIPSQRKTGKLSPDGFVFNHRERTSTVARSTRSAHEDVALKIAQLTFPTKVLTDNLGPIGILQKIRCKIRLPMVLGSRDSRFIHQHRPINMNGRSILSETSQLG